MNYSIHPLFKDKESIEKIKNKLLYLFQLAEIESSRAGKIGMEVGSLRERILVSMLIYKFGLDDVETEIPITEPETDVLLNHEPISIKTYTGTGFSGVKVSWTVDPKKALEFKDNYKPICHILLVKINWDGEGGLYFIPKEVQQDVIDEIEIDSYIKLPKVGTNPRGVEFNKDALEKLAKSESASSITINWIKKDIEYNVFRRWIEYWKED